MTAIKRSKPRITAAQFSADRNDEVRNALNKLGRVILPCVDTSTFYITDLMYDALKMADMADGAKAYVFVTECGTHFFTDPVVASHTLANIGLRASFEITCTNPKQHYLHRTWAIVAHEVAA